MLPAKLGVTSLPKIVPQAPGTAGADSAQTPSDSQRTFTNAKILGERPVMPPQAFSIRPLPSAVLRSWGQIVQVPNGQDRWKTSQKGSQEGRVFRRPPPNGRTEITADPLLEGKKPFKNVFPAF